MNAARLPWPGGGCARDVLATALQRATGRKRHVGQRGCCWRDDRGGDVWAAAGTL